MNWIVYDITSKPPTNVAPYVKWYTPPQWNGIPFPIKLYTLLEARNSLDSRTQKSPHNKNARQMLASLIVLTVASTPASTPWLISSLQSWWSTLYCAPPQLNSQLPIVLAAACLDDCTCSLLSQLVKRMWLCSQRPWCLSPFILLPSCPCDWVRRHSPSRTPNCLGLNCMNGLKYKNALWFMGKKSPGRHGEVHVATKFGPQLKEHKFKFK